MSDTSWVDSKKWLPTHRPRRDVGFLRRGLWCYALLVAILGWLYLGWQIQRDRQVTENAAFENLAIISLWLNNHLHAMINDGVGAAEAGLNEFEAVSATAPGSVQANEVLARMLTGGEYLRSLFIVTSTSYFHAHRKAQSSWQQTPEWLVDLRKNESQGWVGPRQQGESDEESAIPIAKRAGTLNSEVVWVGAEFDVESLDNLYQQLHLDGGAVAVVNFGGAVLLRAPQFSAITFPASVADWRVFRATVASQQPVVRVIGMNQFFGKPWLYVARRLNDYGVFVIAGQDQDAALAEWRTRAHASIGYAAASTAALFLLTLMLYRVLNKRYLDLEDSEDRYEVAVAGSNEGLWDWDITSGLVYYSPRFRELLGYRSDAEFAKAFGALANHIHPEELEGVKTAVAMHLTQHMPFDQKFRMRSRTNEYRWYHLRGQALWFGDRAHRMAGSLGDIHEQVLTQESLLAARENQLQEQAKLSQHLLHAQEQERKRIANELHDSLGQNLSLITNRAELARRTPDIPGPAMHQLDAIVRATADAIADVRQMVSNLLPLQIESIGLTASIVTVVEKLMESSHLAIKHQIDNLDDVFVGGAATHVYRIVQESLSNIVKHAHARRVEINIERDVGEIRIKIFDDGRGFDPADPEARHGVGLGSIRERAHILGGHFLIESSPGNGTTVKLSIPIEDAGAGSSTPLESQPIAADNIE